MTRNKKSQKPKAENLKKSEVLNSIQQFYVKGNLKNKTVAELASDLNVSEKLVQDYLDSLMPPATNNSRDHRFAVRDGTVCMTEAASLQADRIKKKRGLPERLSKSIFIPRPDEPTR